MNTCCIEKEQVSRNKQNWMFGQMNVISVYMYSKTCLKRPLIKKTKKLVFKTDYHLMQVKCIAECSKGSILQYFWPSLSYQFLPLRPLISLFLSGRLRQVLLYMHIGLFFKKCWFNQLTSKSVNIKMAVGLYVKAPFSETLAVFVCHCQIKQIVSRIYLQII